MTTRRELLVLLRTRPGSTAADLARALSLSSVAVRRHLSCLVSEGLVERGGSAGGKLGRPASGWRLSREGLELFPRRYDVLALELLEDLSDVAGPAAVDAVLARRTDRMVAEYESELAGADDLHEKVQRVARLRDEAGYVAECRPGDGDDLLLVENNCAVHRVAAEHASVCNMELTLLSRVLGPDAEVTRVSHTMGGDAVCCYRVRPRPPEDGGRQ